MNSTYKYRISRVRFSETIRSTIRRPHLVFLIIGGLFGILYVFLVPPFLQPDEVAHFDRVYQISEGHLGGQKIFGSFGSYIPKSVISFENEDDRLIYYPSTQRTSLRGVLERVARPGPTVNDKVKLPVDFVNTEAYNPVLYSPQVVGMLLARGFNLSAPSTLYLVRCLGFIAWLIICTYGISKMKQFGWAADVLLLTPLCLQIVAAVTADGMTIAFSVLFVGLIVDSLMVDKWDRRKFGMLLLAVVLLACTKIPYMVLAVLLVLIPTSKFKNAKQKIYLIAISAVAILCITGAWSTIAQKDLEVPYRTLTTGIDINQKVQEAYLLHHPLSFMHKIYDTYLRSNPYTYDPLWGYVGVLSSVAYTMPNWAVCLYFVLIGGVFATLRFSAKRDDYLNTLSRAYVMCAAIALFIAINAAIFITWSRIKVPIIEGIQSRYFIPLAPLLILIFLPIYNKAITLPKTFYYYVPLILVVIQLAAVAALYYQFYAAPMPVLS